MKLQTIKQHRRRSRWSYGLFHENPVFVAGLGLPLAVMCTYSVTTAAAVSLMMACSLIPTVLLACLIGEHLPRLFRLPVYTLFSLLLVSACRTLILARIPAVLDSMGLYVPIIAVSSLTITLCQRYSLSVAKPGMALVDGIFYSLGFTIAMLLIACIREPIGNGTLGGQPINLPLRLPNIQFVFFGFILVGLLSAFFQAAHRVILGCLYRRENSTEAPRSPHR